MSIMDEDFTPTQPYGTYTLCLAIDIIYWQVDILVAWNHNKMLNDLSHTVFQVNNYKAYLTLYDIELFQLTSYHTFQTLQNTADISYIKVTLLSSF